MLTRTFLWAVSILCVLPEPGARTMQSGKIAHAVDATPRYLEPLIQHMSSREMIISKRGPAGGYTLGRPADEISLEWVWEMVLGFRADFDGDHTPPLSAPLQRIIDHWRSVLVGLTISDLKVDT